MRFIAFALAAMLSGCNRGDVHGGSAPASSGPSAPRTGAESICDAALPAVLPEGSDLPPAKRAARQRPRESAPWVVLGHAWMKHARVAADPGFYVNVEACAAAAVERSPADLGALELRGFVALDRHRFRDAATAAEGVLAKDPGASRAWGLMGDALLELGELEGARSAVQHMLDLRPGPAAYGRAAHLAWLGGDISGAKEAYRRAIESAGQSRDPEPAAWFLVEAATVFWHEGDYAGADAGFDVALTRVPDYAPAMVGKGRVALSQRRFADAAAHLERALAKSPTVEASWLLGDARLLQGDERAASAAYDQVLVEGRRRDRRTLSAFLSSKRRDPSLAVSLARAELGERPSPYSKDALAWALYRAGALPEARALCEEVARSGIPDARLLFHAGAVLTATGDAEAGRALVRRAVRMNPAFDAVESAEANALLGAET